MKCGLYGVFVSEKDSVRALRFDATRFAVSSAVLLSTADDAGVAPRGPGNGLQCDVTGTRLRIGRREPSLP